MECMKMWKDRRPFEINVKPGWQLWLSRELKIPLAPGYYNGMIGDGFEIRTDKNFICKRPLYVIGADPHHELLALWSAVQEIYSRDDCTGYVPNGLLPKSEACDPCQGEEDSDSDSDSDDDYEEDIYISDSDSDYDDDIYIEVPTADCKGVRMIDAMFLGPEIPVVETLTLKEVMPGCLYTVHDEKNGNMRGYLIHMLKGIAGPDFKRFHSDEGYYEVSVVQNSKDNPVDFIALLGNQNELNRYKLDRLEGRVDIDDLFWFDKHVKRFTDCAEFGPGRYPNKKYCGGSHSGSIQGIYAIVPAKIGSNPVPGVNPCESTAGVDSLGRKYKFPDKAFRVLKIKQNYNMKRYNLIDVSNGGHISVEDCGNVTIRFKVSEKKEKKHWEFDDSPVFRMYTDISYACYYPGDWSDYDADPDKTIAKYEAARRKAHDGYYKLPLKEPCCEVCDKDPIHKRCPKEVNV